MIYQGDCITVLKEQFAPESVQCCVTSPPYWGLRDYGCEGQLGLEKTPEEYVAKMVAVFREVRRVLKADGTLWLNLGDSYAGSGKGRNGDGHHSQGTQWRQAANRGAVSGVIRNNQETPDLKAKDLVGIPWRVAFALQADGWYLRSDIIWAKPNPMPESVTDRPTKSHEYIFLLSKSARYYYNSEAIKEPAECGRLRGSGPMVKPGTGRNDAKMNGDYRTRPSAAKGSFSGKTEAMAATGQNAFRAVTDRRNKRTVWTVATQPYAGAHFATFPPKLIEPCILAGCPPGGRVLDPFAGAGTTLVVARKHGRQGVGIELNPAYITLAERRIAPLEVWT